jgi:branched-chain amino acid transport system substrate-binding protein
MNRCEVLPMLIGGAMVCAVNNASADEIRVGISAPMSGPSAIYGAQVLSGVEQAVEDLNAGGGVLGKLIELVTRDDKCDPGRAKTIAEELVDKEKVTLVIGPACSAAAIAALPIFGSRENQVVDILPSATASALTERGLANIFRIVPRADRQGPIASAYLQQLNGYNVAILSDESSYAAEIDGALRRSWPRIETDAKLQDKYSLSQTDFSPLIERLRGSDIKVVYVAGVSTGLANLIRQARANGLQALFVASDAAAYPQLWSVAGDSADGMLFTFFPDPTPEAGPIVQRMQQKGREPSIDGLYAYAALQVWTQAASKAGTFDAHKVSEVLHAQRQDSVIGPVAFDSKGDIKELNYVFYQRQKGKVVQMNHRPPPPPPPPR